MCISKTFTDFANRLHQLPQTTGDMGGVRPRKGVGKGSGKGSVLSIDKLGGRQSYMQIS
jgi:hypothetical protein